MLHPTGMRRTVGSAIAVLGLMGSLGLAPGVAAQEAPRIPKPAQAAPATPQQQVVLHVPQPEVLLALIRSALIGLDQANRTGNYSVLREMGGPTLQQLSSAQLANAFASLRAAKVDLMVAAIATPQLTQQPAISPQDGVLRLIGIFPTQPRQLNFHIIYQPANGEWKLAGLNVGFAQAPPPNANAGPPAAAAKTKTKTPAAPPKK